MSGAVHLVSEIDLEDVGLNKPTEKAELGNKVIDKELDSSYSQQEWSSKEDMYVNNYENEDYNKPSTSNHKQTCYPKLIKAETTKEFENGTLLPPIVFSKESGKLWNNCINTPTLTTAESLLVNKTSERLYEITGGTPDILKSSPICGDVTYGEEYITSTQRETTGASSSPVECKQGTLEKIESVSGKGWLPSIDEGLVTSECDSSPFVFKADTCIAATPKFTAKTIAKTPGESFFIKSNVPGPRRSGRKKTATKKFDDSVPSHNHKTTVQREFKKPESKPETKSEREATKNSDKNAKRARRVGVKSTTGCWTCRIRHKKCPEQHPICVECQRFQLSCHYSRSRPKYMSVPELRHQKLTEIRQVTRQQKSERLSKKQKLLNCKPQGSNKEINPTTNRNRDTTQKQTVTSNASVISTVNAPVK